MKKSCFKGRFCSKEIKDCHSQFCRPQDSGIFRILSSYVKKGDTLCDNDTYVEDPRLQASGMTANLMGFTLIELLVVVLIIGILAAVAVPQYRKTVELNEAKMMLANMHAVKKAENVYKLANGTYTLQWKALDFLPGATSAYDSFPYGPQGKLMYALGSEGSYWHVMGYPRDDSYMLYLSFESKTQLCYPFGTDKGKRVCRALGCAENELDSQYCSLRYRP